MGQNSTYKAQLQKEPNVLYLSYYSNESSENGNEDGIYWS